jgi:carboxyl-terminal processing protease
MVFGTLGGQLLRPLQGKILSWSRGDIVNLIKTLRILLAASTLVTGLPLEGASKYPDLQPRNVPLKVKEILAAHASYKTISPELAKRILESYLNECDPSKLYFVEEEIDDYLNPDSALVEQVVDGFRTAQFGPFEDIYRRMQQAIERRESLESELNGMALPSGVKGDEFKDLPWAKTQEELKQRLLRLRAVQFETAKKWVTDEPAEQVMARIAKRRQSRESQFADPSTKDGMAFMLSNLLKAFARSLDSHTAYFTPGEAQQFLIQVQQRLYGIGAQLRDDMDGLTIVKLIEGGPGERGGKLKAKDKIIAVNTEPVVGMDITDAVELIRGPAGSTVMLTILRKTGDDTDARLDKLEIPVVRDEVVLKDQRFEAKEIPFGCGLLGYIHLHAFYGDSNTCSADDLYDAISQMRKDSRLLGVLLDLRRNGGGLLPQAVEVAGLFIDKGVVCSIKHSGGEVQHLRDFDGECIWRGPLVILIDRSSASAAEIVAQSLQDWGRAVVVGDDHSFGKGTFQTLSLDSSNEGSVNPQGEYKVTRGRYYTVSGQSPQLTGVQSDITIPGSLSEMEIGEKFEKYPLGNDTISPNFVDTLSDLSMVKRVAVGKAYRSQLQKKSVELIPLLPQLKENSRIRQESNVAYKNYLKTLTKSQEEVPDDNQSPEDHQLQEALNVLRDLVLMSGGYTCADSR